MTNPRRLAHIQNLANQYELLFNCAPSDLNLPSLDICEPVRITEREVLAAISHSKKKSASGLDGVGYQEIHLLTEDPQILKILTCSFNKWTELGPPKEAKHAKISPVPKGNCEKDGFRPISLLSCTSKLNERILTTRINRRIGNRLPANQCGCRAQLGTLHCVARLFHASAMANCADQHFAALFLDFSKAYDRVKWSIVLEKMTMLNLPPSLTRAVGLWLTGRSFSVHIGSIASTARKISNGLPQGSALSVTLWLIYIHDFPTPVSNSALFMDDSVVWKGARTKKLLLQEMATSLQTIEDWCSHNSIVINQKKSAIMLNTLDSRFHLRTDSLSIHATKTLRYLGFHLYSIPTKGYTIQLDLNKTASDVIKRCRVLQPLARRMNGKMIMVFGKALIISKIRYFLPLLAAEHSSTLAPLRSAYHHCLRSLTGALYGTPNSVLYSQSGLPPIEILIADANKRFYFQLMHNPSALLTREFEEWTTEFYQDTSLLGLYRVKKSIPPPLLSHPLAGKSPIPPEHLESLWKCSFAIGGTREVAHQKWINNELIPLGHDLYVYTDGSFTTDQVSDREISGAAFCIWNHLGHEIISKTFNIEPATNSYYSENLALQAALDGLSSYLDDLSRGRSICILSDSKSLLSHLAAISLSLNPRHCRIYLLIVYDELQH